MRRLVSMFCLLTLTRALPVVISRYGGKSVRRDAYRREEKRRLATCHVAMLANPDITIGKCPVFVNEYTKLYERDSTSFLQSYYKNRCDIVKIEKKIPNCFADFIGTILTLLVPITFIILLSITVITCIISLIREIYVRIINFILFLVRLHH